MVFAGGFLGALLFGIYLWLSNRLLRLHDNEALLCQSSPDYKHFLRLRVGKDGSMDIFPVGVRKVIRSGQSAKGPVGWALQSAATGSAPWFEPATGTIQAQAELIEAPVPLSFAINPGNKTPEAKTDGKI
jgi:hypothetical protein